MSENKRYLEGCEKLPDGRYRIHEKMTVTPIKCKEPITEKIIVEGKEVSPKRKYTFLVWKKDKIIGDGSGINGNQRNYSLVIPRTIKENRPTFTLADHPQDGCDADSVRITGCGKNYRMIGDWMATDWYPLGEIGNRLADGFDLGVPATISSSVLGELDDNGYVVDSDTYFLERILDNLIDFPSNGVYHYADHNEHMNDDYSFETISENGFKESVQNEKLTISNKENIIESSEKPQNDKTDEIEDDIDIGEKKMPETNTMNDELVQQSMILNIKSMIKDADKLEDVFEKKASLESADCFAKKLTDETLHNEICKKIEDVDNEIKELSKKGLENDDLIEKCKKLEGEISKTNDDLNALKKENEGLKRKLKTITDMYEDEQFKASEGEIEKSEELEEKNHRLSKELCSLKAKNRNLESIMRKNQKLFESKMKRAEAEINSTVDVDAFMAIKSKCKKLENDNAELCKKIEDLETTVENMKKVENAVDVNMGVEEILALKKKLNEEIAKNNRLRRLLNEQRFEKKESRFSKLRKTLSDEETDVIVDDDIIEDDINDKNIVVNNDGINVVDEDENKADDFMERALSGNL